MKWLTGGGLAAALAVGGAVAAGLGWRGAALLLAFFVSGSLLTQWSGGGGGQRNARQVLANGGVAAAGAVVGRWEIVAGALAAAAADTWATEIGSFSPSAPRLITTWSPVSRGASGGITLLGTAGGVAGAVVMAVLSWALEPRGMAPGSAHPAAALAVVAAGVVGMLADSVLGATAQALYECPQCAERHERAGAVCHEPVRRIRGWVWLDNDAVNLAGTLAGAGTAALGLRLCCSS